ncbi:MAG: right-handed parallel beta-helix repeat-containing protein [Chitinispirillaceae bacterium]|nr:right-handed parallel beta-helix repeat-containing protein [Chitinispirillaceae bacterium]
MYRNLIIFFLGTAMVPSFAETLSLQQSDSSIVVEPFSPVDTATAPATDALTQMPDTPQAAPISPSHAAASQAPSPTRTELRAARTRLPAGVLFGTFTKEEGPFFIEGNVIVPSGQILEFGPACTVYVGGYYSTITVFGQLFARGTAEEPVVFTSAKRAAQPWDWDRIYCRSRNRSLFEHCIIRHSNYGIYVENGSAGVNDCRFERNSLHGIVVKNSDLNIAASSFIGGHIVAMNLLHGSLVSADSLFISENTTGISCAPRSKLKLTGGQISGNTNGVIAAKGSSIEIVAAEIIKNKTGVIAETEIPKKMREMVYANTIDVSIASSGEMKKLLKEPQPVRSIVLPKTSAAAAPPADFKAGFSALNMPQEPTASFIGNVTTGVTWYGPRSTPHPKDRDTAETFSQKDDGTIDTVRSIQSTMHRQSKYPGEQSEKWYGGIQPELQFFANGRRRNADINLLMDLYGNQWLSTNNYLGKNMFNISMNYAHQSLVIGDFFESTSETSIPGRQMTGVRYSGKYLEMGRGEKRLEFKLAAGETEIAKDSGDHEIFVYNQTVDTGMSKRQQITYLAELNFKPTRLSSLAARGIILHDQTDKPLFRKPLSDPAALDPVSAQTGCISGAFFLLERKLEIFGEIDLGSADTLDDSAAEAIAWYNPRVEKAVPEVFSLFNRDDFFDHYAATVGLRGNARGYTANVKYLQIAPSYYSAGDPYLVSWRKNMTASIDRQIRENLNVAATYEFDRTILQGVGEDQDPSVTDLNIGSIISTFEMGEGKPSFSAGYTLQHKRNDARESVVREDTSYSEDFKELEFSNRVSVEGKQAFDNGMAYSLRYQLLWDNDYGEHPDELCNDEGDRLHNAISGWFSLKIRRILRNKMSLRLAMKHENRDSLRAYQYKLADQLFIHLIPRKLTCAISGEYSHKSEKEYEVSAWQLPLLTNYYSAEVEVKYSLTSRLTCSAKARYEKSYDDIPGSSENYSAPIAGLHVTYLF